MVFLLCAAPTVAQSPIWPGQIGNSVGFAAAPGWPGSFTATACPSSPANGTSWANATLITNCTYSTSSHTTVSCNFCEFEFVDFKSTSTSDNDVFVSGANVLFVGDRFQSNYVGGAAVSVGNTGVNTYFFFDSVTPLVSFYISPPGAGCSETTPGNIGCTNWPSAGAGANSTTFIEETGFTPGATTPSNANAINGNKGYELGFEMNTGGGAVWIDSCDIWGAADSIINQTSTAQQTITNNWMHDSPNPTEQSYHIDGYGYTNGGVGPDNVLLTGNATAMLGNTNALAMQGATGGYQHINVEENFFSGDNATIAYCRSIFCSSSAFYGNVFGTDVMDSGISDSGSGLGTGSAWACNTIEFKTGTTWTNTGGWTPLSSMNGQYILLAGNTNSATDQGSNTLCGIPVPSAINFGNQSNNTTSAARTITFYSTNTANLSISSIALATGTQFSISSNTCGSTLNAGSNCAITVKFSPTSLGPVTDTLEITDNTPAASSPQLIPLAGISVPSSITQVNVGGFQSVIPRPNVRMTNNLLTCANFSCATNGSPPPSPWLTINGCAGCVATNAHIHQTGGLSLLLPNAGTSAATLIQQQVTMPGNGLVLRQSGFALTGPLVSGAFVFQTDGPSTDNTHGGVFPQTTVGMTQPQAIGSSTGLFNTFAPSSNGWFSFERDNWIFPQVHNADSWNVGIRVPNGTNATGNTYVGDLDVSLYGWPVALFPTFPGEPAEGYFFGDRMASVYQCGGPAHNMPTIILGMNCYRAEIEKPANVTLLSSLQLTVLVGTGPGCSGGTPAVTGSGSTPVLNLSVTASVIPIAVDGSAWTVESTPTTPHRVCTTLFDSQNSITYTWPDYVLYDVGVAFYSTFNLWPNVDQSLVRMGQPFYIHGVYDDPSGTYNYGSATAAINWSPGNLCPGQATATLSWTNCIGGIGDLFASPISPVWTNPSPPGRTTAIYTPLGPNWITDLKKHHYNTYLGYAWVTQNPTPGTSDAFGGLWDTMGANGITYGVELNAWHGTLYCLGWVDAACDVPAAPSAVTVNSTGGTIAAPSTCTPNCYWWIETAPGGWNAIGQGGDEPLYGLSSAPTVSTAVTGSTNSVGVTFATCHDSISGVGRQDWTLVGGAWSTSNVTQPSPDAFQPIHDPNTTGPPECPANSVTLIGSQTTSSADTGDSNQVGYFPTMMPANDAASGDVPILCLGNNNPAGIGCTTSSCVGGSCGTVAVNIVAQCMSPTKLTIPSNQIGVAAGVTVTAPTCPGSGFTVVYFSIASNPAHLTSPLSWPKFTLIQQPGSPITAGSGTFVVPAFASAVQAQEIPTDLSANGPAASWMNGLSQSQVLAEVAYTFCQGGDATNFPNATKSAGILYPWDEADPQTKANMQAQLLGTGGMKSYCPGAMTFGAVSPGAYWMGRYYMDFAGSDPYDYGISGGGEVFWQGTSCRTAPRYGGTYNTVTPPAANCSTAANISLPQITDATTRALLTESYATRPLMIVDMNFQRVGAQHGFVAHELFLSSMRHIFEGWEAGANTCCNFWWQRNDMGLFVQQYGNTQAEADTLQVDNEIEDLADVRFQPIVDSTFTQNLPGMFEPGLGTIVSNVEYFAADGSGNPITTAVACNIPAVANNFTDTTQYPYGAGKMWTKYSNQPSAAAPDQRAGFVWSCGGPNSNSTGGVAVFMRVTSPNLPPGQTKISVRWEARTITIGNNATCPGVTLASNQWCDGWNPVTSTDTLSDFDVHLYDIDQVRHNRGTGSINGTGSIQTQ